MAGCQIPPTGDDHGDTRQTATSIMPAPVSIVSGQLEGTADIDYFGLVVTSTRTVYAATRSRAFEVSIETAGYASSSGTFQDAATIVPGQGGSAEVYVRVSGAPSVPYQLAVWSIARTEPDPSFDIDLVYVGAEPTAKQRAIIRAAAGVWENVVASGFPDEPVLTNAWRCRPGDPDPFGDVIDDLRIYFRLEPAEETSAGLARAGTCWERSGGLPLISEVILDTETLGGLGDDVLRTLVVHEVAHALGFGSSRRWDDMLQSAASGHVPDEAAPPDTHFPGQRAVSAFDEVGGGAYRGRKVPVENDAGRYGAGSVDNHWRESVFGPELMTPRLSKSSGDQPLSTVTIAALADLGYHVDFTHAEAYTLPGGTPFRVAGELQELHLGDDIRRGPTGVALTSPQPIPRVYPLMRRQ
ncbi:MAG: hypothetical protein OXC31_15170 [Spirochaetaceae bacterium]|nr:hypothetical protein [Spirochaetaceae bacterium]